MKNSSTQIDRKILKTLEPLNRLNPILLDELAAKSIIDEVPAGRIVCRYNDKDSRQIYLLSGQIEIATQGQTEVKVVKTKTALTKPVAEGSPRNVTVKTKSASTLLYIDADLLELLLSDEPDLNTTYDVTEIESDSGDDWMLTFLQSPAFLQLPTENIQKLLTHMEEIPVKKDQVVITQGGSDDNYYIIKNGSCNVHRKPFKDAANVLLAVLPTGSGFGEEALITNGQRNATITMREDGALMRLKKKDFLELLITPLINYFEHNEFQNKIHQGNVVIDVRSETASKQKPLEGAVNIPLSMLRMKFDSLNSDREYILVCNDGSQSAAAAFLMISNGFKCSVLHQGLNSMPAKPAVQTAEAADNTINNAAAEAAIKQAATAKKQAEHIAAQQKQIKEAREKAEQDIIKRKQELADSRARIADKNQKLTTAQNEALQLKEKAQQELEKAQAESKLIEQRQKETNEAMQRAEEIMKQSELAAIQARKQAEEEAALIKQRAIEEAEYLRAEVFAARQQMEQDSARIKQEEEIIKSSALQIKNEADEIRRKAMSEAEQIRLEIEQTRVLLSEKLQQTQEEEKRKHDAIVAEAQKRADELAATKTQQAAAEAESIRQKAKEDAKRLHSELEETRKQIEAEAARVISELKEQSKQAATKVIEEEPKIEAIAESAPILKHKEEKVDYKAVSIPGMSAIEPIDEDAAKAKAEAIKTKLAQAQALRESQEITADTSGVKVRQTNDNIILEGDEDLFIFKAPDNNGSRTATNTNNQQPQTIIPSKAVLTQIQTNAQPQTQTKARESVVIYPKQEQESVYRNNPFLNKAEQDLQPTTNKANVATTAKSTHQFNKQAYAKKSATPKSNTFAIAASFLLIIAGAVFTLHATNTLKVDTIASLFNSGNDTVKQDTPTAVAKKNTIRQKVLRADSNVNVKEKVETKMDNIMQGWKEVLEESKNPKKITGNNQ